MILGILSILCHKSIKENSHCSFRVEGTLETEWSCLLRNNHQMEKQLLSAEYAVRHSRDRDYKELLLMLIHVFKK